MDTNRTYISYKNMDSMYGVPTFHVLFDSSSGLKFKKTIGLGLLQLKGT